MQKDRQDPNAAGWDYHEQLSAHESQTGTVTVIIGFITDVYEVFVVVI